MKAQVRIEYPNATFYYGGAQAGAIHLLDWGAARAIEYVGIDSQVVPVDLIQRAERILTRKWERDKTYER